MNKQTKELNVLNNQLEERVSPENGISLANMTCYLRGADISEYNQEVVRHDLLEMILSAQERRENVQTVIGEDYKKFCDHIIENLQPRSRKEKIIEFLNITCSGLSILFFINIFVSSGAGEIIGSLFTGKKTNFLIHISAGSVFSSVLIVFATYGIVKYIMSNSFERDKKGFKIKIFGAGAAFVAVFVLIAWFGKATLFTINIFVALLFAALLFLGHKVLDKM